MPKKEFEAFTRLDASDVNTFLMDQSVMTFGSATARDAAIDTPVEGQVTYLTDIDSLTVYNGTQWVTNRPVMSFAGTAARGSAISTPIAGMTTYLEDTKDLQIYDGTSYASPFGMTLIEARSFTSQNSVIFNNVFSSLYDSYQIITNLTASGAGHDPAFTLRVAGVNASTNYQIAYIQTKSAAVNGFENLSGGAAQIGRFDTAGGLSVMTINNVAVAARTFAVVQSLDSSMFNRFTTWMHTTATAYDGVEFGFNSGTGTIRIYGIRKS
jgi:hypothetical protein